MRLAANNATASLATRRSVPHCRTNVTRPSFGCVYASSRSLVDARRCFGRVVPRCAAVAAEQGAELHIDISRKIFTEAQLAETCAELGRKITADYEGVEHILVLSVLKGSFVFAADVVRNLRIKYVEVDFIKASSYGNAMETSGTVDIASDGFNMAKVKDRHVLIVEDIVDSGNTLTAIVALIKGCGAASVKVVTLLDKKAGRKVEFEADYVGLQCPNEFIVGYGIDYAERYRHLPYIGVIKPEAVNA